MKFDAIIQSRMSSKRLTNKIFFSLGNTSVLEFLIKNLKKIKEINKIIIAVPFNLNNEIFKSISRKNNVYLYTDSSKNKEEDVLKRFYFCAKKFKSNNIIRITPDCPFINIHIVKKMINHYKMKKLTFLTNNKPRKIPHGFDCEIFNFDNLKKSFKNAKKKDHLEHVTKWLYENEKKFIHNISLYKKNYSKIRITLDYIEDYNFFFKNFLILKKLSVAKKTENILNKIDKLNKFLD